MTRKVIKMVAMLPPARKAEEVTLSLLCYDATQYLRWHCGECSEMSNGWPSTLTFDTKNNDRTLNKERVDNREETGRGMMVGSVLLFSHTRSVHDFKFSSLSDTVAGAGT